ncbi:ATP-dependent RNA helicase [Minicystis rosea]|nr:ATP-dependent RNA helicase [Minicystis rosea]
MHTGVGETWTEAIDADLAARLARRGRDPGVLDMELVRRIIGWIEYLEGRLPLLAEMSRRFRNGARAVPEIPIVHARWMPAPGPDTGAGAAPAQEAKTATPVVLARPRAERAGAAPLTLATAPHGAAQPGVTPEDHGVALSARSVRERSIARASDAAAPAEAQPRRRIRPAPLEQAQAGTAARKAVSGAPVNAVDTPLPHVRVDARQAISGAPVNAAEVSLPRVRATTRQAISEAPVNAAEVSLPRVRATTRQALSGAPVSATEVLLPRVRAGTRQAISETPVTAVEAPLPRVRAGARQAISETQVTVAGAAPREIPWIPRDGSSGDNPPAARAPLFHAPPAVVVAPAAPFGPSNGSELPNLGSGRDGDGERQVPPLPRSRQASADADRAAPSAPAPARVEIDIDALTDQVQRRLLRQVAVERERKGVRR